MPGWTYATEKLIECIAELVVGTDPIEDVAAWRRIMPQGPGARTP